MSDNHSRLQQLVRRAPALHLRRDLLGGLAALACLPAVHGALAQSHRQRVGTPAPLRFVMMFTGNGHTPEQWLPTAAGDDFELSQVLAPLEPIKRKLVIAHGLSGAGGHSAGMKETTTGRRPARLGRTAMAGPSIDQYFAHLWRTQTPLPSLELGVHTGNDEIDQICYSPRGFAVPPIASPSAGFDRVFAATNEDPTLAREHRKQHISVLDQFARDLARLQAKIGASSRQLLDEHLTLVREREQELQLPFDPLVCEIHAKGEDAGLDTPKIWAQQTQTMVAALRCGATRVASLRAGGWGGISTSAAYAHLGDGFPHHAVAHGQGDDPVGRLGLINHWHCQQFADLLAQLDAVPEDDATLLDHTLVVWFNELGLGPPGEHARSNISLVLAGGSKAGFANGRFVEFPGTDYQHLLCTLARTIGDPQLTAFGDHGTQTLTELLA